MKTQSHTDIFEAARPQLLGLAYRLLGSLSDAQDAVQDTYLKWISYDGPALDTPAAWLSRVCTNRCIDHLKLAHHKRVDYVGQWIPEQFQTEFAESAEEQIEIASSLTTAFLLLLERLTPKERAAYLLHDIFAKPFDEIASILDLQPANCRKLATRAREYIAKNNVRHVPEKQRQTKLLDAFQSALQTGDTNQLGKMLRTDSDLRADSGGKVIAVREVLEGQESICSFISNVLSGAWSTMNIFPRMINGALGLHVEDGEELHAAISFGFDSEGQVSNIYIMRNPEKLSRLVASKGVATGSGELRLN
jgi:RNA polymerase sigma-70 factor, ECF subfamily